MRYMFTLFFFAPYTECALFVLFRCFSIRLQHIKNHAKRWTNGMREKRLSQNITKPASKLVFQCFAAFFVLFCFAVSVLYVCVRVFVCVREQQHNVDVHYDVFRAEMMCECLRQQLSKMTKTYWFPASKTHHVVHLLLDLRYMCVFQLFSIATRCECDWMRVVHCALYCSAYTHFTHM